MTDEVRDRQPSDTAAFAANLANWESRVPVHVASADYDVERYVVDPGHLSDVVRADAPHLGDLSGVRVVHLQCHIGTDTLSLARLGAEVTGVDFSPAALAVARDLADRAGASLRYVESSIDDVPERLQETFDLVYTGVGALNWLPSMRRWATIAADLLAPGGRLYVRDFHPMAATLDDARDDHELVVTYPYFESAGPQRWDQEHSYTQDGAMLASPTHYEWNHGLAETVQAVLDAGLRLTRLHEGTRLDWRFLPWMVEREDGFVLPEGRERLPLEFTLEAVKPATRS